MQTAWTAHDYPAYLNAIQPQLPQVAAKPQAGFSLLVTVAIALEQTHGWDGDTGKAMRDALAPSPDATRELQACRQLLAGDAAGLTRLFDGPPPDPSTFAPAAKLAHEAGYALAADCLTTANPGELPGLRVKAWLRVPADQRAPVDAVMTKITAPVNLRMLATMALDYYITPPTKNKPIPGRPAPPDAGTLPWQPSPDDFNIPPAALLVFARTYANGLPVVSYKTAERLLAVERVDEGLARARETAAVDPARRRAAALHRQMAVII